jgi:hypothetical protein
VIGEWPEAFGALALGVRRFDRVSSAADILGFAMTVSPLILTG